MQRYSKTKIEEMQGLRREGYSIVEIGNILDIPKTTVLRHIRGTQILPENYQRWLNRKKSSLTLLRRNLAKAKIEAAKLLSDSTKRESAIIAALLYWAEGAKSDPSLINSDPKLIATFIRNLRKAFDLTEKDFTISIRIYEDLRVSECITFWSNVTGLKLDSNISFNILEGSKKGKLQYGMCRVRIKKGGLILKTLFAIVDQINVSICPRSSVDRAVAS